MTLEDLRVFVAVCRAGSLSAVARELACTQSAVSQHVKRLEREAGVSLLERRPRGVVPTYAGASCAMPPRTASPAWIWLCGVSGTLSTATAEPYV